MKIKRSFEKQSFMIDCLIDIAPEHQNDEFQSIYYLKPNNVLVWFDLWISQDGKKRYLGCSYDKIWSVFYNQYNMKYIDNQKFIQNMVLRHTNWGLVTPVVANSINPTGC